MLEASTNTRQAVAGWPSQACHPDVFVQAPSTQHNGTQWEPLAGHQRGLHHQVTRFVVVHPSLGSHGNPPPATILGADASDGQRQRR
jgi:hypothetical protein